jgi:serine/threonine-protein kinase
MATVYVARQVGVGGFERLIAIKRCHEHLRANQAFAAMFLEEARLAARIRHPNVVATIDVCDEDALYLVMEYVEATVSRPYGDVPLGGANRWPSLSRYAS